MSHIDTNALCENLRSVLKYFARNLNSSKYLNEVHDILERNDVLLLNWGSTIMSEFLDACNHASSIIL